MTFLVLDDDAMMLSLVVPALRNALASERAHVDSARDPRAFLELVRAAPAHAPLAILCDYDLKTTQTGLDVLSAVREMRPDALRILFSGRARHEIGPGVDSAVVDAFFEKPMRLETLLTPLRELVRARLLSGTMRAQ